MTSAGRPLYFRLLRVRQLRNRPLITFLLFEGSVVLGVLLALAEIISWWGMLAVPATVAIMVKLNDAVAVALARRRTRPASVVGAAGGADDEWVRPTADDEWVRPTAAVSSTTLDGSDGLGPADAGYRPAMVSSAEGGVARPAPGRTDGRTIGVYAVSWPVRRPTGPGPDDGGSTPDARPVGPGGSAVGVAAVPVPNRIQAAAGNSRRPTPGPRPTPGLRPTSGLRPARGVRPVTTASAATSTTASTAATVRTVDLTERAEPTVRAPGSGDDPGRSNDPRNHGHFGDN